MGTDDGVSFVVTVVAVVVVPAAVDSVLLEVSSVPEAALLVTVVLSCTSSGFSSSSTLAGPTTASTTLSPILVTMATRLSCSKTIDPTSPSETDGVVTNDDGWLAGLTPVKFPDVDVFANDV